VGQGVYVTEDARIEQFTPEDDGMGRRTEFQMKHTEEDEAAA